MVTALPLFLALAGVIGSSASGRWTVISVPSRRGPTRVELIEEGRSTTSITLPRFWRLRASVSADGGTVLLVGCVEGDVATGARVWFPSVPRVVPLERSVSVQRAWLSPDARWIVGASLGGAVAVWSATSGKRVKWLVRWNEPGHYQLVPENARFSADGSTVTLRGHLVFEFQSDPLGQREQGPGALNAELPR
jgi:hypothetical protein